MYCVRGQRLKPGETIKERDHSRVGKISQCTLAVLPLCVITRCWFPIYIPRALYHAVIIKIRNDAAVQVKSFRRCSHIYGTS